MTRKTYVYQDGKMIEKHLARPTHEYSGLFILPDIQPFKSPITGEEITSRNKLQRHMKEHEVARREDYSPEYFQKAEAERQKRLNYATPEDRRDRIEAIKYALEKRHG